MKATSADHSESPRRRHVGRAARLNPRADGIRPAQAACTLGLVFAAVSAYWGLGGTWLLDTIGGSLERQARTRHATTVLVLLTVAGVKTVAAVLPLLALRRPAKPVRHGIARVLAWADATILVVYGLVYTAVGLLIQAGVVRVSGPVNHRALAWHAYLWDPWFLIWGLLAAVALVRGRHTRGQVPTPGLRDRAALGTTPAS